MTTDRFTQCPHCNARFRVSSDQLSVADGRVRCGACLNVFDAIAYSVANPQQPKSASDTEQPNSLLATESSDQEKVATEYPVELEESILEQDED